MENKNWHVVYVQSRTEKKVLETLLSKGIQVYLPLVKTLRQWSDRKKMVEFPLLPGYVFVRIALSESETVLSSKHVINFVREEGAVALVRDWEIDRLKQVVDLGYSIEAGEYRRNYNLGEKVKIKAGALKGIEGYITQNKNGKYIEMVVASIGQSIKVKLPEEILIPID